MKTQSFVIFSLLTLMLFLMDCCNMDDCLHEAGSNTTTRVETGYFKQINIRGIFDILLTQDSIQLC